MYILLRKQEREILCIYIALISVRFITLTFASSRKKLWFSFLYGPSLKFILWSVKYTKRVFPRINQNSKLKSYVLYCKIVVEKSFFTVYALLLTHIIYLPCTNKFSYEVFIWLLTTCILRVISCYNFKVQSLLYEKKRLL